MFSRNFVLFALALFAGIALAATFKKSAKQSADTTFSLVEEVEWERGGLADREDVTPITEEDIYANANLPTDLGDLPDADRINELFSLTDSKLPFVQTITYNSKVPWKKGRAAWVSDYANHFNTSRHFIARSLNGRPNYLKQDVHNGDRFNVYRQDVDLSFHLLVDLSRAKLWLYAYDQGENKRYLLKTYRVGLGRLDSQATSGSLTPLGKYALGNRVMIYRPGIYDYHKGVKTEMIRMFGTRWIPFEKELANCTESAAGYGIHGSPWEKDASGQLKEDLSGLGKFESDGCIRLSTEDIEEVYAIIVANPSVIEIVRDFREAELPGVEI